MANDYKVPAVIRGQVLQQGAGFLVRGQYVIGYDRKSWFWYDIYNRAHSGGNLTDAQTAFDQLAAFISSHP